MGKTGIYLDWLQEAESPQYDIDWVSINSYEKFKDWLTEEKRVPDVLSLGFQLNEVYQKWMLDPENEEKSIDYPLLGSGSVMSCLVLLYQTCLKNELEFPEIYVHTEFNPGIRDIQKFLTLICRENGWTPRFKIKQLEIKEDYEQGENWETFQKLKGESI